MRVAEEGNRAIGEAIVFRESAGIAVVPQPRDELHAHRFLCGAEARNVYATELSVDRVEVCAQSHRFAAELAGSDIVACTVSGGCCRQRQRDRAACENDNEFFHIPSQGWFAAERGVPPTFPNIPPRTVYRKGLVLSTRRRLLHGSISRIEAVS